MTVANSKIVEFPTVDNELDEIAGDVAAKRDALTATNGRNGHKEADLLPPDGEPERYDDLANSKRFLQHAGGDLSFCPESKKWMIWHGTHWEADPDRFVHEMAEEFAERLYTQARDKEAHKNATRANNRSGFNAFLELAQRKVSTSIAEFDQTDATGYLLNVKNGTLDLRTGKLDPHDRQQRITRYIHCDYEPDQRSLTFLRFLERIQPDPDIRAFLQRSIGYSLFGVSRERAFWILYGSGNNGKSIFTNLFNKLLGPYASTTPAASLMDIRGGSNIPNDIARLRGTRFCLVPETQENERLNAALVKALSAGDTVSARFLFGEFFDFQFTAKLWIATNHKPTITDHSKGMWDRMKLVPFTQDIPAGEVIKSDDLMRQLMADKEAVLAWAVQGARDYFEMDGLDVPAVIQAEIDAYKFEQDSIAQFLEERCQTPEQFLKIRPDGYANPLDFRTANGDLYAAYKKFCDANGEYLRSHKRFSQNMIERGFKQVMSAGRYWDGVRLTNTEI